MPGEAEPWGSVSADARQQGTLLVRAGSRSRSAPPVAANGGLHSKKCETPNFFGNSKMNTIQSKLQAIL